MYNETQLQKKKKQIENETVWYPRKKLGQGVIWAEPGDLHEIWDRDLGPRAQKLLGRDMGDRSFWAGARAHIHYGWTYVHQGHSISNP